MIEMCIYPQHIDTKSLRLAIYKSCRFLSSEGMVYPLPDGSDEQCRSIIGIRTDEAGKHLYPELDISNAEFAKVFREIYPAMQEKYPAENVAA